jgi:[ribosomal protein S18]-alanine N-acetyltransferase
VRTFRIEPTSNEETLDQCAIMMSKSEPWITLKRGLDTCREAMRGNYKEVYVCFANEKLLGFIVLQMAGVFKGYIQSICVSPEMRGSGFGTALIDFAEKRIFSVSPNVFMLVSAFNEDAARLYFKLGYEKIGTLKNFVIDGYDELFLRKTIGPLNDFSAKIHNPTQ